VVCLRRGHSLRRIFGTVVWLVISAAASSAATVFVQRYVKRPRLRVALTRIHARVANILDAAYFETSLAELYRSQDRLDNYPPFRAYLDEYIEIEATLSDATRFTISEIVVEGLEKPARFREILRVDGGSLGSIRRPVIEDSRTALFYIRERNIPFSAESITRVAIINASGKVHKSLRIRDASAVNARLEPVPGDDELADMLAREDHKPRAPFPQWLGFGMLAQSFGWHVGARLIPEAALPLTIPFDERDAEALAGFLRTLRWEGVHYLTVPGGVLLADVHSLTVDSFRTARRQMHVADDGALEVLLIRPELSDLDAVFVTLATLFATARFIYFAWRSYPLQRLTFGYATAEDIDTPNLRRPSTSDQYATLNMATGDFAEQFCDVVYNVLRDGSGTLRDRKDILAWLRSAWNADYAIKMRQ